MTRAAASNVVARGPNFDPSLLEDGGSRDAVRASHPLTTDSLLIATPAVRRVFNILHHVVMNRLPGTNFTGEPRIGKTFAQRIIRKMLAAHYPGLPVGQILAMHHDRVTEGKMWGDICASLGLIPPSMREPHKALHKIVNAVVTQCEASKSSIYILLCDEVQEWGEEEWTYMKDLSNLLAAQEVHLITIGFGQEGLHQVRETIKSDNRRDLIGRFLKTIHSITGIQSLDELQQTFAQLDDPRFDYPLQSGICYSEFFMPNAYAGGWRLHSEAVNLWAAFNVVSRRVAQRAAKNVGMSVVILSLKEFLRLCAARDQAGFKGTRSEWLRAVEIADYAEELCWTPA